jgi:hypothetical protein
MRRCDQHQCTGCEAGYLNAKSDYNRFENANWRGYKTTIRPSKVALTNMDANYRQAKLNVGTRIKA